MADVTASVFDIFKVGIGPSSSHTVGPMKAARMWVTELANQGLLGSVEAIQVELFGSLGATMAGHGTNLAILLGLEGHHPATVDPGYVQTRAAEIYLTHRLTLRPDLESGGQPVQFDPATALVVKASEHLPRHPNALRFTAQTAAGPRASVFYSVGGGFVVTDDDSGEMTSDVQGRPEQPYYFRSGTDLLDSCWTDGLTIPQIALANETAGGASVRDVRERLAQIWSVMDTCIELGSSTSGTLPGGLGVRRRAPLLHQRLKDFQDDPNRPDPMASSDWVAVWALAVNEQNAAGGRVVTAPTNGASGVIPAVLRYALTWLSGSGPDDDDAIITDFLLTAGAIGSIYKSTASISGAEVGCQGEVGVASSMAAAGLCQIMGGTPQQVCNAAEIGLEHHLGLTCDPVAGLVQVPCIERNAMGAITAIAAARLARAGDGHQLVSLDQVISTMMATGADMMTKYKETALGGLALAIVDC